MSCLTSRSLVRSDLFEDVLFPHQFLPLSVGFAHDDVQHRLTAVDDVCYKENDVLQQFDGKPDRAERTSGSVNVTFLHPALTLGGLVQADSYRRSFWLMKPSPNWSTTVLSMALASLAKSRSLISITGTETIANASLSSLVGHVPSLRRRKVSGLYLRPERVPSNDFFSQT